MAMRGYVLGTKFVLKESGGKFFPSRAVPWTDNPSARPARVIEKNEEFKRAVEACRAMPKYKGGTVWGKSKFNECIGEKLKK